MSHYPIKQPVYNDGRTKQSFRDETDINKIMQRAQKTGTISHLNKHQASYADFSDFDYFESVIKLAKGREIFDDLPSELRTEFHNSPADFFQYVNDPDNVGRLDKLLPGLAAPGRQNIDVSGKTPPDDPIVARVDSIDPPEATPSETTTEAPTPPPNASER